MITKKQIETIKSLKFLSEGTVDRTIPIKKESLQIGSLLPLNQQLVPDDEVIQLLTRWRQKYMHCFTTQFRATNERTVRWLTSSIIPDDDKILFLIRDETEKAIGQIGVNQITHDSAEIGNIIRGEKGKDRSLMYFAALALLDWLFTRLEVHEIYLYVFTNNDRAISLYESLGFVRNHVSRLIKQEANEEVSYIRDDRSNPVSDEFGLMKMTLHKEQFLLKFQGYISS